MFFIDAMPAIKKGENSTAFIVGVLLRHYLSQTIDMLCLRMENMTYGNSQPFNFVDQRFNLGK